MKHEIYKTLRIIFCLLAVACCAVMIFVFVFFDWWWGVLCAVCAAVFTLLMLLFKRLQVDCENAQLPANDFINSDSDK